MAFGDSSKFARKGQAPNVGDAQLGSWKIRLIASLQLGVLALAIAAPAPNDVAVVVHPAVTVDDLTFGELRHIFLADKMFWSSKLRVTILIPAGRERLVVLKTVYQMTDAQFRQFWISNSSARKRWPARKS
jgi:hypothetical protein